MNDDDTPADRLRKLPLLIAKLKEIATGAQYDHKLLTLSVDYVRLIIEMLEAARDALAAQDAPAPSLADDIIMAALGNSDPAPRGLTLPTHEEIRAKYFNRINPPTAFERLLFDTAVDNPEQGEALRAFFEWRA